jgi:predicted dienelactone hydrolase
MTISSIRVACILGPAFLLFACGGDDTSRADGGNGGSGGSGGEPPGRLFDYVSPGELGPYPIGMVQHAFVDASRPELATIDETDHRTLPTVIWYPAGEDARGQPTLTYGEFATEQVAPLLGAVSEPGFTDTLSSSVKDASVATDGPFPLIVFSHGNGGLGVQSFFLTEYLASHGYIVVCPDHTGNAIATELPDGRLVPAGGEDGTYVNALLDRVDDASFLVDAMEALDGDDPEERFTGRVDLERVGITGHSFGGITTLLALDGDPRFGAGAPMTPVAPEGTNIEQPVMYFIATEDQTLPNDPVQAHYDALNAPKMYLSVIDAGHFSFSNGCPLSIGAGDGCGTATRDSGETFTFLEDTRVHEITKFYQTALWGHYLKGVEGYADDLLAEPFGNDVDVQRDGMP